MRWTRLHSVEARSLLRKSHQILTALIGFTRTYCGPWTMMVNLKYPAIYDGIGGFREHDIVVGEFFVSGGYKGLVGKSFMPYKRYRL